MDRHGIRVAALAWAAAWVVTALLLAGVHYESRDPDSQLYAGISARLVHEPVAQWIAPQWWGFWKTEGPYCEHPVGMFVVPALLGRAGYPPEQAAYAVNAFYQVASLAIVTLIAALVTRDAVALGWILQLLPIAFVFRVRANQEYAVLAGLLLAIYATERARTRPAWIAGMVGGFCAVLLIKGVFAFMVPVACGLWLVSRAASKTSRRQDWPAWSGVLLMPVAGAIVAWGYEAAYVHVTGRSFLEIYRSRQLPEDALASASLLMRVAYTVSWYSARILWYAFPWSVVALAVAVGRVRRGEWWPPSSMSNSANADEGSGRQAAWFALVTALVLTAVFSLAHRKADRYIFPVYFLVSAAGAGAALQQSPGMARIAKLNRPWIPAAVYVILVLLTVMSSGRLPAFTFWRS